MGGILPGVRRRERFEEGARTQRCGGDHDPAGGKTNREMDSGVGGEIEGSLGESVPAVTLGQGERRAPSRRTGGALACQGARGRLGASGPLGEEPLLPPEPVEGEERRSGTRR